jgi:hypothetical protein
MGVRMSTKADARRQMWANLAALAREASDDEPDAHRKGSETLHGPTSTPATDVPAYLDRNHAHYPPKLAAGILAWLALEAALAAGDDLQGKEPMAWMESWLVVRLKELRISPTGAKQAAAIANWRGPGARKKTPGG